MFLYTLFAKLVSLTQAALAGLVGVCQKAVSKWERCSAVPRSAEVRWAVVEVLGAEV